MMNRQRAHQRGFNVIAFSNLQIETLIPIYVRSWYVLSGPANKIYRLYSVPSTYEIILYFS